MGFQKLNREDLRSFVKPYYKQKDAMHALAHVDRLLDGALALGKDRQYNSELILLGAYFHGIITEHESALIEFISARNLNNELSDLAKKVALESLPESEPVSIEGALLHDAHLLEGGQEFLVTKSLLTGCERGQSLSETIEYMRSHIIGKRKCVLPEAQEKYQAMDRFASQFIDNLEASLDVA